LRRDESGFALTHAPNDLVCHQGTEAKDETAPKDPRNAKGHGGEDLGGDHESIVVGQTHATTTLAGEATLDVVVVFLVVFSVAASHVDWFFFYVLGEDPCL
jgi:hypothetical protein